MYSIKEYIISINNMSWKHIKETVQFKLVRTKFKGWAFFPIYFQEKITYSNTP